MPRMFHYRNLAVNLGDEAAAAAAGGPQIAYCHFWPQTFGCGFHSCHLWLSPCRWHTGCRFHFSCHHYISDCHLSPHCPGGSILCDFCTQHSPYVAQCGGISGGDPAGMIDPEVLKEDLRRQLREVEALQKARAEVMKPQTEAEADEVLRNLEAAQKQLGEAQEEIKRLKGELARKK